jgi:HSP20 family protein
VSVTEHPGHDEKAPIMLMRTDPSRELDRLTHQVLGTAARPAVMPVDACRSGGKLFICLDLPCITSSDTKQAVTA